MARAMVTGGNTGIGFALCKQLVMEHGCHVYLGARNAEKGQAAVDTLLAEAPGRVELLVIDTSDASSTEAAARTLREKLGEERLQFLVNNAGTGLQHGVSNEVMMATNLYGTKKVCEEFIPLLAESGARVVNVSSGAGPMYMAGQSEEVKRMLSSPDVTWEQIQGLCDAMAQVEAYGDLTGRFGAYGLSKACLTAYTQTLANMYPNILFSAITPGFIDTAISKGHGATKPPEEGTVSIRHCLFAELGGSGWYYGSDATRSPMHIPRQPGDKEFNGEYDWTK